MVDYLSGVREALADVNVDDRSLIKRRLLMLGYKYYCNELETPNLDLVRCTKLLEKPMRAKSTKAKVFRAKTSEAMDGATKDEEQDNENAATMANRVNGRKSRPDSMKSYPFADDQTSMREVLKSSDAPAPQFIRMGAAARKRLAAKVYGEQLMGRSAMSLETVPDGLRSLGLMVSDAGEELFADAALKKKESGARASITRNQWVAIVERYVASEIEKEKKELQKAIAAERKEAQETLNAARKVLESQQDENEEQEGGEEGVDVLESSRDGLEAWEAEGETSLEEAAAAAIEAEEAAPRRRPAPYKVRKAKEQGLRRPKGTRTTNLRNARSRIGEDVRADREHYARVKMERAQARLEVLGKKRVDELAGSSVDSDEEAEAPATKSEPIYSWAEDIGLLPPSVARKKAIAEARHAEGKKKTRPGRPVPVHRWDDTTSGSAALEIADAFFKGSVGRELMRDDPEADSEHPFADVLGLSGDKATGLGHGHRTVQEHKEVKDKVEDAKKMYAEGWSHRKGGWVADFGAPHTRLVDFDYQSTSGASGTTSGSSAIPNNTMSLSEVVAAGRKKHGK